jgi:hypothetical protein
VQESGKRFRVLGEMQSGLAHGRNGPSSKEIAKIKGATIGFNVQL